MTPEESVARLVCSQTALDGGKAAQDAARARHTQAGSASLRRQARVQGDPTFSLTRISPPSQWPTFPASTCRRADHQPQSEGVFPPSREACLDRRGWGGRGLLGMRTAPLHCVSSAPPRPSPQPSPPPMLPALAAKSSSSCHGLANP